MRLSFAVSVLLALAPWGWPAASMAQTPDPSPPVAFSDYSPSLLPTSMGGEYRIGQDDLVDVSVFEIPELSTVGRVTASGVIALPLIGPVGASGLTPQELGVAIEASLKEHFVKDPHVTVFVREYASQPVSIVGAVVRPGIYQIKGQKYLLDMLALAQGLTPNPGSTIQVIRRPADPNDPALRTITIRIEDLFELGQTELNIPIFAGDVINVLQAGSIFVVGETREPGEYVLRNGRNVSVTQAIALGGGFTPDAKKGDSLIIRMHKDGHREEIPIDPDKIMRGDNPDLALMPNDILWVPSSKAKPALRKALDTAIAVASGLLIYGR